MTDVPKGFAEIADASSLEELAGILGFTETTEMSQLRNHCTGSLETSTFDREGYLRYLDLGEALIDAARATPQQNALLQVGFALMQAILFGSGENFSSNIAQAIEYAEGINRDDVAAKIRQLLPH